MIKIYDDKGNVCRVKLSKAEKLKLVKENNKLVKEQELAKKK